MTSIDSVKSLDLIYPNHFCLGTQGERVGVTSKVTDIKMYPLTDASRRRLQLTEQTLCSTIEGEKNCHVTGTMSFNDAATLHQAFCNSWNPRMLNINQGCAGGGVDKVRLTCNGRISVITDKGLSDYSPVKDPKRNFDTVFPAPKKRYYGTAWIYNPNLDTVSGLPCLQDFTLGMYCSDYNDAQECAVLIAMDENTEACWGTEYVELCGNADDFMEGEEGR